MSYVLLHYSIGYRCLSSLFYMMVFFRSYFDAGGSLEECIVDMVNSVEDGSHPSSRFPVPDYYRLVIFMRWPD